MSRATDEHRAGDLRCELEAGVSEPIRFRKVMPVRGHVAAPLDEWSRPRVDPDGIGIAGLPDRFGDEFGDVLPVALGHLAEANRGQRRPCRRRSRVAADPQCLKFRIHGGSVFEVVPLPANHDVVDVEGSDRRLREVWLDIRGQDDRKAA